MLSPQRRARYSGFVAAMIVLETIDASPYLLAESMTAFQWRGQLLRVTIWKLSANRVCPFLHIAVAVDHYLSALGWLPSSPKVMLNESDNTRKIQSVKEMVLEP